ncbi:putative peptide synthetase [Staphylotrichum tortipilum]|uniref:Peptide synthetase n=1 Tax=Staphylotrichum tortipilum TaxID=2831512 RepID=A0AAN6MGX3_9PEZI|nr:putative peptide synthetase [Staphylotrichum longicolle]
MGSSAPSFLSPDSLVDDLAARIPDNVWAKAPVSADQGPAVWQDITWRQLRVAVDFTARWMENELGVGDGHEPIAYTGPNDIRYPIIIMAALKAGHKSFLTSPRNSLEGNLALLRTTKCTKFVFTPEFRAMGDGLAAAAPQVKTLQVPDVGDMLASASADPYESRFGGHMQDHETVMILHTSGTTGLPKPVYLKAGVLRGSVKNISLPTPEERENILVAMCKSPMLLTSIPFFHIFGIMLFSRSLYHQGPLVLLPAGKPPTAELLLEAISNTKPTALACTPSLLEDMCGISGGLEGLATIEHVIYGGAPLAQSCGNTITKVTTLTNGIGSTEAFNIPNMVPADPAEWEYFEWNPNVGIVMELTTDGDDSGLAELVIHRQPENDHQLVFHNYPDLTEWRSNDLYERHPSKPALWRYVGRADDVIVLSNGEKVQPVSFEKAIEGHAWVRGALMVGSGQFQTALIIEPHPEHANHGADEFLDELWPWVDQANQQYQAHARVWRSLVSITSPDRPFQRSPKGSVIRHATCRLYDAQIKLLYAMGNTTNDAQTHAAGLDLPQLRSTVRQAIRSVLGSRADALADDTDLFSLNTDSLQVLQIRQILSTTGILCAVRDVYQNPSVTRLAQHLHATLMSTANPAPTISREQLMSAMIHRHSNFAQPTTPLPAPPPRAQRSVLLVGSTGALGTHLLHCLLSHPHVGVIYALNRSRDATARQTASFREYGLDVEADLAVHPRVRFLTGETAQEGFGLGGEGYEELVREVDVLVLNAWPVNFNSALESFEGVMAGVKRCVEMAAGSARRAQVVFVSSVASATNYPAVRGRREGEGEGAVMVPEVFEFDNSLPERQGYGESKHVASSIIGRAVREGMLAGATVMRVGQLAGTAEAKGMWNTREWLPTLVKTSRFLGKIPTALGPALDQVAWVPVDLAAKAILDLSPLGSPTDDRSEGVLRCFNIVNPKPSPWSHLATIVQQYYAEQGLTVAAVSLDEWLEALKAVDETKAAEHADHYPALKLLDFFEGMKTGSEDGGCGFATEKGVERSATMTQLEPVGEPLMRKWLNEWSF